MMRVWNREKGVLPLPGTFLQKARERMSGVKDRDYVVIPALTWWCIIHKWLNSLFEVAMVGVGFESSIIDGITIWDNFSDSKHVILFFHGIVPDGLVAQTPFISHFCPRGESSRPTGRRA